VRTTVRHLVGREEQLEAIARVVVGSIELPSAVVLPGEAGIGKTTVWLAGLDAARETGYRTLTSRPSESEARFSYAGVHDLLGDAAGDVLSRLPAVQRRALEAALLLREAQGETDDRSVAVAFLGAVRLLADEGPVCIAIDDVQWLDPASLAALSYALARVDGRPVVALLSVRGPVPAWLRRTMPERLHIVEITGLSVGAVQEIVRARLGVTFPRPTLIRLWETARGNPFFALELAGALQRRGGTLALGEELPIPSDLDELLQARIEGLGVAAIGVARAVAALSDPTVDVVESAVGHGFDSGVEEALAARILELDRERLRFTHPLLGSAVAAHETPSQRRSLHARLADFAASQEERDRHLALATAEPDDEIAARLEEAARAARARGAPAAAAELAEQALRLTPPADATGALRRVLLAAERYHVAGDVPGALRLLEQARADAAPGVARAAILVGLGDVLVYTEPSAAEAHWAQALDEAIGDDALEASIHTRHARMMAWRAGIEQGVAHATLALRAAARTDDIALQCCALASESDWRFRGGQGIQEARMQEAVELERSLETWPLVEGPTEMLCLQLIWAAEIDRARELAIELRDARRAENDPLGEAEALWFLGLAEWRGGEWDNAERHALAALELKDQLGGVTHTDEFPAVTVAAHRGHAQEARAIAERAVVRGVAAGIAIEESGHRWVLGFLALSEGDSAAAVENLRRSYAIRDAFMLDPGQRLELGDLLESLIAIGELDEAEGILTSWEPRARAIDRAWGLAILARCRGLLLAARGELDGALASFERSLVEHARCGDPFQHARTLLALGRTQRRAKKRAAARTTLDDALARFERLGAPLWAEQARGELARIGGRTPSDGELTEAERRIAALVAEGNTNREVAAALFLTEHTVETALTRIYRKLGVRSRAELARMLTR
jgi:DNA-binding CsgD family transcriptional regulator